MSELRRLRFGLMTLLGIKPQGFFIPYRYAHTLPRAGFRGAYGAVEDLFRAHEAVFAQWLDAIDAFPDGLRAIGEQQPPEPRWRQSWFPRLDAAAAYALVRRLKPKRIVEIGSGHSTRFIMRALRDGNIECAVTCIDPAPRAQIDGLPVKYLAGTLHQAGLEVFRPLEAGDILFVDSSHILMPGSDVDLLLNRIMPRLPKGVIVHVHDIFLPDDYPGAWEWRGYNEQQGVAPLLLGASFRPLFSSHYVLTRMGQRFAGSIAASLPLAEGAFEASLWLRKEA